MSTSYHQAQKLFEAKKIPAAALLFEKAIKEDPSNIDAKFKLGVCWFRQKKFESAEKMFRAITANNYDDFKAWYYLGLCAERQGRENDAFSAYKIALAINPQFEAAKQKLGIEKTQKNNPDSNMPESKDTDTEGPGKILYTGHRRMSSFIFHWILIILLIGIIFLLFINLN